MNKKGNNANQFGYENKFRKWENMKYTKTRKMPTLSTTPLHEI